MTNEHTDTWTKPQFSKNPINTSIGFSTAGKRKVIFQAGDNDTSLSLSEEPQKPQEGIVSPEQPNTLAEQTQVNVIESPAQPNTFPEPTQTGHHGDDLEFGKTQAEGHPTGVGQTGSLKIIKQQEQDHGNPRQMS